MPVSSLCPCVCKIPHRISGGFPFYFSSSTAAGFKAENLLAIFSLPLTVCGRACRSFSAFRSIGTRGRDRPAVPRETGNYKQQQQSLLFFASPLEYTWYAQVTGPACVHKDTHSLTHTPNPRAIVSNLQVRLSVWYRRNGPRANNNIVAVVGWPLKTARKLITLQHINQADIYQLEFGALLKTGHITSNR